MEIKLLSLLKGLWKTNIDILAFFLEYSRIQDGRLKTLSFKFIMLNVIAIVAKTITLFYVLFGHAWDLTNIFVELSNILWWQMEEYSRKPFVVNSVNRLWKWKWGTLHNRTCKFTWKQVRYTLTQKILTGVHTSTHWLLLV